MNSVIGTIIKTVGAAVASSIGSVKLPIKKVAAAASTQPPVDPFSEMEKGRVLEWWVLIADR